MNPNHYFVLVVSKIIMQVQCSGRAVKQLSSDDVVNQIRELAVNNMQSLY